MGSSDSQGSVRKGKLLQRDTAGILQVEAVGYGVSHIDGSVVDEFRASAGGRIYHGDTALGVQILSLGGEGICIHDLDVGSEFQVGALGAALRSVSFQLFSAYLYCILTCCICHQKRSYIFGKSFEIHGKMQVFCHDSRIKRLRISFIIYCPFCTDRGEKIGLGSTYPNQ